MTRERESNVYLSMVVYKRCFILIRSDTWSIYMQENWVNMIDLATLDNFDKEILYKNHTKMRIFCSISNPYYRAGYRILERGGSE